MTMKYQNNNMLSPRVRNVHKRNVFSHSDCPPSKKTKTSHHSKWVLPKHQLGGMYVEHDCRVPVNVQPAILALPKKFFSKNARKPMHPQGQMQLGFSNAAGQQCTQVCGINVPYRNKNHVDLAEHHPQLLADIQKNLGFMWSKLKTLYPEEAQNMLETSAELRFGSTGFVKVSIATNFDALWHVDRNNQRNGIQALLVLGKFEGGDVCLDPAGRTGKIRTFELPDGQRTTVDETNSKGSDIIKIKIKNAHGTFFCGSYKSIWHSVRPILKGHRTIIAAYCREDLAKFDRAARRRYGIRTALQLHDDRLKGICHLKRVYPEHAACPRINKKVHCKCGFVKLLKRLKSEWKQIDLLPIVVCNENAKDDGDVEMHCADVVPEPIITGSVCV